jgi:hypothetical protein
MSIFNAPSFYNQADQDIYNQGFSFIPQEQFRGGAFKIPGDGSVENDTFREPIGILLNQGGGGGGGGFNPYNANMSQTRTDFRPDTDFRQFQDFGNLTDAQLSGADRKARDMYPEYYGLGTGVPETGIRGIVDSYMKNSLIGRGLGAAKNFVEDFLPVNQRAILENQLRGQGVLTDDIGRIVAGPGGYNTPEGIMAGYNASRMTDKTFDKRTDTISQTLRDKYNMTDDEIDDVIAGTYKGNINTNLIGNLRNIQIAKQNFLASQTKANKIKEFREAQKAQEKLEKQQAATRSRAEANRKARRGGYQSNFAQDKDFMGGGGGGRDAAQESRSPGSSGPGGSDTMGSFAYGGRVPYMMGGLTDLVDIYD